MIYVSASQYPVILLQTTNQTINSAAASMTHYLLHHIIISHNCSALIITNYFNQTQTVHRNHSLFVPGTRHLDPGSHTPHQTELGGEDLRQQDGDHSLATLLRLPLDVLQHWRTALNIN